MQPIHKEFLEFLKSENKSKNVVITDLHEGKFWLDNHIIKAFTADGRVHNLYRYHVDDNLNVYLKKHKDNKFDNYDFLETWKETVQRLSSHINQLESDSLKLLSQVIQDYSDYKPYVLTSTGKDSTVAVHIAQKVIPSIKVVFNNTSLDSADTYKMVKAHKDWIITNPQIGFYQWIKKERMIPTRFSRACCTLFKEGNMISYFNNIDKALWIMRVRNDESSKRADRRDITHNPKWGGRDWYGILPIRKWSELDIWLYILKNNRQ